MGHKFDDLFVRNVLLKHIFTPIKNKCNMIAIICQYVSKNNIYYVIQKTFKIKVFSNLTIEKDHLNRNAFVNI